ncbi:unnamed protein product [Rotaria sp. Silwood2]|nr:unnamed protein product [Rotaria sp. Silwood2]CAF4107462.1 unnamed protein product [Rotaria sp. Silwood2]
MLNDSSSDIHLYPFTSYHTNKKRKQNGNEHLITCHHDESSLLQQINGDTSTQTKSTSPSIPLTKVTDEVKHYAQSRYLFPPFLLHFKRSKINDKNIINELLNSNKTNYSFDFDLAGFPSSSIRSNDNECHLFIFVKNSLSFSFLYSDIKWPDHFSSEVFTIDRQPAIPPQLALVLTNISYKTNLIEFENQSKAKCVNIVKAIRLQTRNQYDTKLVKVEFSLSKTRDDILSNGSITMNYRKYDVEEFLPVATILICSNCMRLGHFRKQCKQSDIICKICEEHYEDPEEHGCQDAVIKQYRADLTKTLLSTSSQPFN